MQYAVVLYESADDLASKAPEHFPAHVAHWERYKADGTLVMIGAFGDPQNQGSMAIFTSREAAEDFARTDPFVLNGVVARWEVRDWTDALS